MDISIVIPTHRRHESLLRCLDSCLQQQAKDLSYEILIVSNTSDLILRRWLEPYLARFPQVYYGEANALGVNRARNYGLERARGKFIYFLDDDCRISDPNFLKNLQRVHSENPDVTAVGGYYHSPGKAALAARYYNRMSNAWADLYRESESQHLRLLGGNSSYRAEVFAQGLRFDESIRYGGAETELQTRLLAQGHRFLLSPELSVEHDFAASWSGILRRSWMQSSERARRSPSTWDRNYVRRLSRRRKFSPELLKFTPLLPYFLVGQTAYFTTRAFVKRERHA